MTMLVCAGMFQGKQPRFMVQLSWNTKMQGTGSMVYMQSTANLVEAAEDMTILATEVAKVAVEGVDKPKQIMI